MRNFKAINVIDFMSDNVRVLAYTCIQNLASKHTGHLEGLWEAEKQMFNNDVTLCRKFPTQNGALPLRRFCGHRPLSNTYCRLWKRHQYSSTSVRNPMVVLTKRMWITLNPLHAMTLVTHWPLQIVTHAGKQEYVT